MKQRLIQILIVSGAISVLVLFITQYFWAKELQRLENNQFNQKVHIALTNVGNRLELINKFSISRIHPIEQVEYNKFVVKINDVVQPKLLNTLLKREFDRYRIRESYYIAIYDCFTDSVVYTTETDSIRIVPSKDYSIKWDIDSHNFGVIFPNRSETVNQLNIWLIASIVPIVMLLFFSFAIYVIIRQKKLDEIKTDFINNMTHELKTPISTISLSSEVLMTPGISENPDRLSRYAKIIYEENQRLKSLVEKVLQMAFFEKKDFELKKELANIHNIVQQAADRFELPLKQLSGKITLDLKAAATEQKVDVGHITNVVSNLIDNAIKYCKKSPEIFIETSSDEKFIYISVKDNGIGMSKEELKNIFTKFYRIPTGNIHTTKGFGIGLNYVKLIIEAHRGTISVDSKLNEGSTFMIKLPME
jgi:two-component system phosphate regulon sensor histidine kinase PhoR